MAILGNTTVKGMLKIIGALRVKGRLTIDEIEGKLVGNADTATKLAAKREIELTGDVTGSVSTDLGGKVSIDTAVKDDSHNHSADNITTGILPLARGGTGAANAVDAIKKLGVTATAAELNRVKGVTSAIQTQLDDKVIKVTGKGLSSEDYTKLEKDKLAAINQALSKTSEVQFKKVGVGVVPIESLDVGGNARIRDSNSLKFGGVGADDSPFEIKYNATTKSLDINYIL